MLPPPTTPVATADGERLFDTCHSLVSFRGLAMRLVHYVAVRLIELVRIDGASKYTWRLWRSCFCFAFVRVACHSFAQLRCVSF